MVDGEPDLSLGVEHAAEVGPGHGKVGPRLYGFQVAGLAVRTFRSKEMGREREEKKIALVYVYKWFLSFFVVFFFTMMSHDENGLRNA